MNKYKNKKIIIDGIKFDSKKEANRYKELDVLEKLGIIEKLQLQKKFVLIPSQYKDGKCIERECSYKADFVYYEGEKLVVEDVKGLKTEVYKIKKKLMLYVHGIQIIEI